MPKKYLLGDAVTCPVPPTALRV